MDKSRGVRSTSLNIIAQPNATGKKKAGIRRFLCLRDATLPRRVRKFLEGEKRKF